jgi:hypothetical protein
MGDVKAIRIIPIGCAAILIGIIAEFGSVYGLW